MEKRFYWKRRYQRKDQWNLWYNDYYGDHMTGLKIQANPWFEMYFSDSYYGNIPKKVLLQKLNLPDYEEIWTEGSDYKPMTLKQRLSKCALWKKKILKAVNELKNEYR